LAVNKPAPGALHAGVKLKPGCRARKCRSRFVRDPANSGSAPRTAPRLL